MGVPGWEPPLALVDGARARRGALPYSLGFAVDSLARSIEANPAVAQDSALAVVALDSAIADAGEAVVATRDLQSQRGRASWLQDRSIGLQDPGATAFLRALEAWRDASTGERGPRAAVVENL